MPTTRPDPALPRRIRAHLRFQPCLIPRYHLSLSVFVKCLWAGRRALLESSEVTAIQVHNPIMRCGQARLGPTNHVGR